VDDRGVVVGVPEHLGAPAVAREDQRRRPSLAGEQRGEVLPGGRRVAHLELDGRPDRDLAGHGQGPGVPVGADQPPDEEVAPIVVEVPLVDDDAAQQPLRGQRPVDGVERVDRLHQALERRPAGQLLHDLALGSVTVKAADRAAAL
jgi:hypothetical protein